MLIPFAVTTTAAVINIAYAVTVTVHTLMIVSKAPDPNLVFGVLI
jgi:hypothetical protein